LEGSNTAFKQSLVNIDIEQLRIGLDIHRSNSEKLKQIFEFLIEKKASDIDKEIILKVLDSCKCTEYKETRFVNYHGFNLRSTRVLKSTHPED
jgi:hypothetical protein